ncbi:hypothetical protein [Bdellovibrio reynosensis]|uniref:Uncharacterized protein n=1 Tax=Bdellovibrio reynosensis TaxID=2835041 RepID=A0ABY4C9Z0_9BACT|nr:hypothetical protein [Bdellovibrio reynosensis]UOF01725.1 hypothetical protein MNR06_01995 [Bdellovibrio reynosensis]
MIVFTWFAIIIFIILVGFTLVGLTFRHWYKESKALKQQQRLAESQAVKS